jgi:hypothetical protein
MEVMTADDEILDMYHTIYDEDDDQDLVDKTGSPSNQGSRKGCIVTIFPFYNCFSTEPNGAGT